MGFWTLSTSLLILQLSIGTLGEIGYRQYRILSGQNPYYYPEYQSYYQNPYVNSYRYTSPVVRYTESPVRYTEPVRTYPNYAVASSYPTATRQQYNDDKVYITDKYGQTTVQSGSDYHRYYNTRALDSYSTSRGYSGQTAAYTASYNRYSANAPSTTCTSGTCGVNAQCSIIGGRPVCSCFRGYMGDPLHQCRRAECLDNSECRGHQHCKNEHCVDPCADICGSNADCETRNHVPVCSCPPGHTGDPFTHCRRFDPSELCHPSPCGPNTQCEVPNGIPTCKCLPGYHGSPIAGCKHECDSSAECGSHLACIDFKCQNPCLSQCGVNSECEGVRNNAAICKCPRGYFGSPYTQCSAECTTHSDCPRSKPACYQNSCKNPCDGVCGIGANCELRDITPICSCPKDMTGDPFVRCRPFEKRDLCEPNPCGDNARCEPGYDRTNQERPVCTCFPGYQGDPLRGCVRGECMEDSNCADHQNCVNYKCQNPCLGQCGSSADCMARRHLAVCTCPPGYNGDALTNCYQVKGTSVSRRYHRQIIDHEKQEEQKVSTEKTNKKTDTVADKKFEGVAEKKVANKDQKVSAEAKKGDKKA